MGICTLGYQDARASAISTPVDQLFRKAVMLMLLLGSLVLYQSPEDTKMDTA